MFKRKFGLLHHHHPPAMTTVRRFVASDLFKFNNINLDPLTETYNISFYLQYLAQWPDYFVMAESPSSARMGYIMGKAEGTGQLWHGHVTALTVAPEFRRMKLAQLLMLNLEEVSEKIYNTYFVDLFVLLEYYSGQKSEDAFDMRKALPRDVRKYSIIPLPNPVRPEDLECILNRR
ncbi:N-alpha-acetyltransferase 20, NatB catalytic subunit-like protein, partial [Chytridium lagenaria]